MFNYLQCNVYCNYWINWWSWPSLRAMVYCVGWVDYSLLLWGWNQWYIDLTFSMLCCLVLWSLWCMVWSTYGGGAYVLYLLLMWHCRHYIMNCEWCVLVGITLCIMSLSCYNLNMWIVWMSRWIMCLCGVKAWVVLVDDVCPY